MSKTKIFFTMLIILLVIGASGQLPKIGEVMRFSNDYQYLRTGCPTTFDKTVNQFRCLPFLVSASFTADELTTSRNAAVLTTNTSGYPNYLEFDDSPSANEYFGIKIFLPSEKIHPTDFTMLWRADSTGDVVWQLDWCIYKIGEADCAPSGANTQYKISANSTTDKARAITFDMRESIWTVDSVVVIEGTRVYNESNDSLVDEAKLEFARLEFRSRYP